MIRTFTELQTLGSLEERFEYLRLDARVGETTFGSERDLNQRFYRSREWRNVRSFVRARDLGMDLGSPDTPVRGKPFVHHMNPIRPEDFELDPEAMLDPEFLITVSFRTHNAIHFGDASLIPQPYIERSRNDHLPWRR